MTTTEDTPSVWTDPATFEDRIQADMDIIQGVLDLASFGDYVDRRHGGEISAQLVDAAIYKAAHGASLAVDDLRECVEQLLSARLNAVKAGRAQ